MSCNINKFACNLKWSIIKKVVTILSRTVAGILLLGFLFYLALMTPFVQTRLVRYFTTLLEERTGTTITIGKVDFRPIESLILNDVYVKGFYNDTLLYCRQLEMRVDSVSFVKRSFTVTELNFKETLFNLWIRRDEQGGVTNVEMLAESFSKLSDAGASSPSPVSWKVNLSKVSLKNCRFRYMENLYEPVDYGINWTDVDCRELNAVISGISVNDEVYALSVSGLSFLEKSGFRVLRMGGDVAIREDNMLITRTTIKTAKSEIHLDTLEYNWVPDRKYWKNFTTKMQQYYVFSNSSVNFDDLAYFNGRLLGMHNTVSGSGVVSNTVNHLEGKNLDLHFGDNSYLRGSFRSEGLPSFFETDFSIFLDECQVMPGELEQIYMPWLDDHYLKFPAAVHEAGAYRFLGEFHGKIEDFIVNAQSITPAVRGGVRLAYKADSTAYYYSGRLNLHHVDYRLFSGLTFLGNGSLWGRFNGMEADTLSVFNLKSRIGYLDALDARFRDIQVSLGMENDHLFLLSSMDNDYAKAEVMVDGRLLDTLTTSRVQGFVDVREWNRIGKDLLGKNESFSLMLTGDYTSSFEDSRLKLRLDSLKYRNDRGRFELDSVSIDNKVFGTYDYLSLRSDVLDMSLEGFWDLEYYTDLLNHLGYNYFPAYKHARHTILPPETSVQVRAELKRVNPLLKVVYPDLQVGGGALVAGEYDYSNEKIRLQVEADSLVYDDWKFRNSVLHLEGEGKDARCIYRADKLAYGNFGCLYNVKNVMRIGENRWDNNLSWSNWHKETYSGSLSASLRLLKYRDRYLTQVHIFPTMMMLADSVWHVERSMILWEDKNMYVDNFAIHRGNQRFCLHGRMSENERDVLTVQFDHFNLSEFNKILFDNRLELFGVIDGQVNIRDFYHDRLIYADMGVNDWGINRDTLGTLQLRSYWDSPSKALLINVANQMNDHVPLVVSGYYRPVSDSLNLSMRLDAIEVRHLTAYFPDMVKDSRGTFSGNLHWLNVGETSRLNGSLSLDSVSMMLTGVNTSFMINDTLVVKDSRVEMDKFRLQDARGKSAECSGFYDMGNNRYDMNVQFSNFKVLDTKRGQNDSFYGQLFVSGIVRFNNRAGKDALSLTLRPEAHSVLYIPLTSVVEENEGDFLHFINTRRGRPDRLLEEEGGTFVTGLDFNANLEINNNLEVQLIFDPTIGDVLKTVGAGDIKVSLDKDEQLSVFGEYRIEKGDYLFTLSNLINKKFVLNPGGTITWNGSPYDALINVSAAYNLRTSLNDLLTGTTSTLEKNVKVPVECVLHLSENLSNPNVQFAIEFPSLDGQMKGLLQSMFSSQDDVNKQVFALMMMNKFYTPDYVEKDPTQEERNAGYQMGVTTASELLSNQLSRWLSQISGNVDIGFAYRPGDELTANEFELALSTQLFDDRVTISANGNMVEKAKTNSNTAITGDFDVDVKLNPQGTLKLKAYSHTDEKLIYNATETVQGIGISYQETFDTFRELWRKYFGFLTRKKRAAKEKSAK